MSKIEQSASKTVIILSVIFFILLALLLIGFRYYQPEIIKWMLQKPQDLLFRMRIVFMPLITFICLPLFWFSVYFYKMGNRVIKTETFPISNKFANNPQMIVYGQEAIKRGKLLKMVAYIILFTIVILYGGVWLIINSIAQIQIT